MLTSLPGFSLARRPITPTMSILTAPWLGKQEDSMQAAADKEMTIDLSVTKTKIRTTSQEQEDEVSAKLILCVSWYIVSILLDLL